MATAKTPRSAQRARVLDAYRGRGRQNSNLWLGYSVKQNEDLIFHSDRSFVHWLAFLESDPSVVGFYPISRDLSTVLEVAPECAMVVDRSKQQLEVHIVAAAARELATVQTDSGPATVRMICLDELRARSRLAVHWLKAVNYAGMLRYMNVAAVMNHLALALTRRHSGSLDDLIDDLAGHDRATVFGAVVRAAIHGRVDLDLSSHGLCGASRWANRVARAQ
ncbi:hypothetical protein [Massilia sp. LjRoot122]|uniref:hypothetical protein n=1 Tax=Massilia sp. LjRoot122 TaxID=3342257 RepID=UPI003ECE0A08